MPRFPLWLGMAILCGCSASVVLAQTPDPPLQSKPIPKSRTWTNDDLQKLKGEINVVGGKDAPATDEPATASTGKKEKEEEKCESDAWVAAVTVILKAQGVPYGSRYWSERLFGDACLSNVSVGSVAARIDGDYTLDDGRKLRLTTMVTPGLPPAPQIVGSVNESRPLIVKWKGQPLVMTHVKYIDRQYDYVSVYSIASLMLTNALTGRVLIFDLKTNSEKEIEGTLQVKVSKRQ